MATAVVLGQAGLFAGLGILWLGLVLVGILTTVFWIWMLIDCLTSSLPSGEKLIWAVVIIFLHFIGALIYYIAVRQGRRGTVAT
jgi:hypothetical protein